jgi:hypothetical protein
MSFHFDLTDKCSLRTLTALGSKPNQIRSADDGFRPNLVVPELKI